MTVSVLIVDDSGFFRRRLTEMINGCPGLKVVGVASNGREGIEKAKELKPDVITMDYEMPIMDGISAVREIMASQPTPILMFSSLTHEGANITLESLEAGAVDYLPKSFEDIARNSTELKKKLSERLIAVARSKARAVRHSPKPVAAEKPSSVAGRNGGLATPKSSVSHAPTPVRDAASRRRNKRIRLVAIGTSTGGPVALQNVLTQLPASYPYPILLIQHMPGTFTKAFAERLNAQCKIRVKEAEDGDVLRPGVALLAPGGKQLMVTSGDRIKVLPGDDRLNYKPSVDITFGSAAKVYGGEVLAVVLTGMGSDGCEGAKLLKQRGATIWAQDEASSVIYGMPMAVARAGIVDEVLSLADVGPRLREYG